MAGLFGVVHREPDGVGQVFDRLFDTGTVAHKLHREQLLDANGHWALGRRHLGTLQPGAQLSRASDVQVLVHGDLEGIPDGADTVRALYKREGAGLAAHLHGSHCTVVLDTASRTVVLINDSLGSYPLYWATTARGLIFASEVRAILQSGEVARELDPAALADCLTFGFPFGTKTLARGVQLVPAGSALSYRWNSGNLRIEPYANVADRFQSWTGTKAAFMEELGDLFHAAVERSFEGDHAYGLALSGGLDSRAILSALNGQAPSLTTYTLGVDGCADQVIADRLASLVGTKHVFFELNNRYLADFLPNLERMVSLTDGMYLSHGLTEMLALQFLGNTGIEVLLRGHGGELAKTSTAWPFHTDARVRAMHKSDDLASYLLSRVNYISAGVDLDSLFTPEWARATSACARQSLEAALKDVDLSPTNLCTYLYVTQHHRRSSVPSLELFRDSVEVRLPFLDERFTKFLLSAPAPWRDGFEIHRALTQRYNRRLLRVRNSNTGAPGDASPLVEAALDKLNTILRRLNVHGYRHYHQFDAWMRQQLLEHVRMVLLDRQALERGIYNEQTLRRLMDETKGGAADHSFLLLVLLIAEIWQRQNL